MLKLELSTEHRQRLFRELEEYKWCRGPGSSSRPSPDLSTQQTSAPDASESGSVSTSSGAFLQPELTAENRQHLSR
eukprot:6665634-Pyramimonas_sp.AAC.1